MNKEKNYIKDANGQTLIGRPRSTHEISINENSVGSMPNNEKDASKIPLASIKAIIAALKSLYNDVDETMISKMLTK